MKWIMIAVIYQTSVVPAFVGPDAVIFVPQIIRQEVISEQECEKLGISLIEKNKTSPRRNHSLGGTIVYGPDPNYRCVRQ